MLRRLSPPLAWTFYLAAPVAGWGLFEGIPLAPIGAAALCVVWWVWASRGRLPWGRFLALLVVAKLGLGMFLVTRGFVAHYHANPNWQAPTERGLESRSATATRIDRHLRFGGWRGRDFPLFFFNDLRFNFYEPGQPERDKLPFSVTWNGYLHAGDGGPRRFFVAGRGVSAQLTTANQPPIRLSADQAMQSAERTLAPGWQRIVITLSAPAGAAREFRAGEILSKGRERPFDRARIVTRPVSSSRWRIDRTLRVLSRGIDVVLLGALGWWLLTTVVSMWQKAHLAGQETPPGSPVAASRTLGGWPGLLPLLALAALADAFIFALPAAGRLVLLGGGDDPLLYEHYARDIVLNGPLMLLGAEIGRGAPFYFQPLYPYFLALMHLVFGEGMFGVFLIQRALLGFAALSLARVSFLLFDRATGWTTLVLSGLFLYLKVGRWADVLLTELLFIPLVVFWVQLLVEVAVRGPSARRVGFAGLIGGLATLTRSTLVLGWVVALPVWAWALRGRRAVRWVASLVIVMLAVVGLATLRNWIVSGRFVPATTSLGVNLQLGNPAPPGMAPASPGRLAVYERLGLTPGVRTVAEFTAQRPGAFIAQLGRKALYALGFFERSGLVPRATYSPWYTVIWIAAIAGAVLLWRGASDAPLLVGSSSPSLVASGSSSVVASGFSRTITSLRALPALVSLGHFAIVVLFFPNVHGDRLIMPLYVLLMPYAGLTAARLGLWLLRFEVDRVAAVAAGALTVAAAIAGVSGGNIDGAVIAATVAVLATSLAWQGFPRLHLRHAWPYLAYLAIVAIAFVASPFAASAAELRRQSLFLALVLGVVPLARAATARRALAGGMLLGVGGALAYGMWRGLPPSRECGIWVAAGLVAGCGAWVLRARQQGRVVCALAAGVCLTAAFLIQAGSGGPDASRIARMTGVEAAVRMIADRPWLGVGPAMAAGASARYSSVPGAEPGVNLLLRVASEIGLIGALCYLAIWIRTLAISFLRTLSTHAVQAAALHGSLLAAFVIAQALPLFAGGAGLGPLLLLAVAFATVEGARIDGG